MTLNVMLHIKTHLTANLDPLQLHSEALCTESPNDHLGNS